ncbi:MAG: endoglucanase [Leifsonia xyli]|nr:MAG: endoglucanase [Leifsonia xyli]
MSLPRPAPRTGFVRADGTRLVDDQGPLLLRGIGLGNWLLAEGYMWRFGDEQSSPRQIEGRVAQLVGADAAEAFWRRFRDDFITEADIREIAGLGFDHVRLPINARGVMDDDGAWREEGFALIERAVAWSEAHGLRILLDLHGAPGGQTGTNIDDSPNGRPELFENPRFRAQTIALWEELARRYRDRESVLGYDLLNEPLPNEWQHRYADELVELYRELTSAIRAIDDRHLLVYEGSHWATNWSVLRGRFDDNQLLQFHRYWCPPDETSIAEYLEVRDALDTPIYMGEGGENTPGWIYAATQLYERHGIGWNFWPWKKLGTLTSPFSAPVPDGWELVADPAERPDAVRATALLDGFLDAVRLENCERRQPVIDALVGRPGFRIPAWSGLRDGVETPIAGLVDGPLPEGLWHHTAGAPYSEEEVAVAVRLEAGSRIAFPLSEAPGSWTVDADGPVDAHWDGAALVVEARGAARVRGVDAAP